LHLWGHDGPAPVWDKQRVEQTGDSQGTEGNQPIRVVLADDHAEFRRGLEEMLLTDGGIEVVGEAKDGAEAIEIAKEERPDVVVLDLAMPLMGGREALGRILMEVSPPPGIVILTMHDGADQRRELLRMGASAFLAKSASLMKILAAVKGADPKSGGTQGA
jgi:DNA-binding NarL/FixJ family response regulator